MLKKKRKKVGVDVIVRDGCGEESKEKGKDNQLPPHYVTVTLKRKDWRRQVLSCKRWPWGLTAYLSQNFGGTVNVGWAEKWVMKVDKWGTDVGFWVK